MNLAHPLRVPDEPALPPPHRLEMPVQLLSTAGALRRDNRESLRCILARIVTFGGAAALTLLASYELYDLASGVAGAFTAFFMLLFIPTFAWIALSAASVVSGLLPRPGHADRLFAGAKPLGKTALVVPVHFEDAQAIAARLCFIAHDLHRLGAASDYEMFILSDTGEAAAATEENLAFGALAQRLANIMPVYYRRRADNSGHKAGNVADFVRMWGGRYAFFLVLDADSVMLGETLVALGRRMACDDRLALVQTVPRLTGGQTPFAWMQRFASNLYGPVLARGVAAWSGSDGNYWGHNALIRTCAFASACGLPKLSGYPPFGGAILSHDFVEAALLRRAGWRVAIDPELGGSYEEGPDTILGSVARDRRWAQGNLQHIRVVQARGLSLFSRVHLMMGIGAYLVSPLWLLSVVIGLAFAMQANQSLPVYFHSPHQLYPDWPVFDTSRMIRLFVFTAGLLLLPKVIGLIRGLLNSRIRACNGGGVRLVAKAALELALAMLIAPVVMVFHSTNVLSILAGKSSGWKPQRTPARGHHLQDNTRAYAIPTALGIAFCAAALSVSVELALWLAPLTIGLITAVPVSRFVGKTCESGIFAATPTSRPGPPEE